MDFVLPTYHQPDFDGEPYQGSLDAVLEHVSFDGTHDFFTDHGCYQ